MGTHARRTWVITALLLAVAIGFGAGGARAGNPSTGTAAPSASAAPTVNASPSDKERARVLFMEGVKLYDAGEYPAACAKFEEAYALVPVPAVQYNIATCWEKIDRTASAYALFLAAAEDFKNEGKAAREKECREHAAALEPKLMKLTIVVAAGNPKGIDVRRDGAAITAGVATFVDPGSHVVTASAAGYKTWTKTISIKVQGSTTTVTVPVLSK